jgi:RNA polymerase sigma-70 factor (ECF subfamily)
MLGSVCEADDAVQEAWVRLSRSDIGEVQNLGGWLTTIVARVCLDVLRSRKARREEPLGSHDLDATESLGNDPEADAALADSVGSALLVVLETLAPAERVAFVLHDMFDVSFEDIATIVGRSEPAVRQLASRARRRVRGSEPDSRRERDRRREVVQAFFAASRAGDFDALLAVLAPGVVLRADDLAVKTARANKWGEAPDLASEVRGARGVAEAFKGRARGARFALIDGEPGAVWAPGGVPRAAFVFSMEGEQIVQLDLVMNPERLSGFDVEFSDLDDRDARRLSG